jgi:hypothetical protein
MSRHKRPLVLHRDVNRENFTDAGRLAREQDMPVSHCPSLTAYFEESRAAFLAKCWVDGWRARDRELTEPRMAMKGAD